MPSSPPESQHFDPSLNAFSASSRDLLVVTKVPPAAAKTPCWARKSSLSSEAENREFHKICEAPEPRNRTSTSCRHYLHQNNSILTAKRGPLFWLHLVVILWSCDLISMTGEGILSTAKNVLNGDLATLNDT